MVEKYHVTCPLRALACVCLRWQWCLLLCDLLGWCGWCSCLMFYCDKSPWRLAAQNEGMLPCIFRTVGLNILFIWLSSSIHRRLLPVCRLSTTRLRMCMNFSARDTTARGSAQEFCLTWQIDIYWYSGWIGIFWRHYLFKRWYFVYVWIKNQ